jgi:hypothetical protein
VSLASVRELRCASPRLPAAGSSFSSAFDCMSVFDRSFLHICTASTPHSAQKGFGFGFGLDSAESQKGFGTREIGGFERIRQPWDSRGAERDHPGQSNGLESTRMMSKGSCPSLRRRRGEERKERRRGKGLKGREACDRSGTRTQSKKMQN